MPLRTIEATGAADRVQALSALIADRGLHGVRISDDDGGRRTLHAVVDSAEMQSVLDAAQNTLEGEGDWQVLVYRLEAALPYDSATPRKTGSFWRAAPGSREEIYNAAQAGARVDVTYLLLTILSTIVVAIGLVEDNVAVVIGGMVIAPLLGPNLALTLAIALGDRRLLGHALVAVAVGAGIALALAFGVGLFGPWPLGSMELMARTDVNLAAVVLALASGAAAALSLTTGLSSALVGVMVAVALLPPLCALGMMLGAGDMPRAEGAALLFAVNVVSINLAAQLVFLFQGLRPRTWYEIATARQSTATAVAAWLVLLALLVVAALVRHA